MNISVIIVLCMYVCMYVCMCMLVSIQYPKPGQQDADLINAGKETVSFLKGTSTFYIDTYILISLYFTSLAIA